MSKSMARRWRWKALAACVLAASVVVVGGEPVSADDPPQPPSGDVCSSGDGAVIVNRDSAPDLIAAYLLKGVLGDACIYGIGETLHSGADPVIVVGGPKAVPDSDVPAGALRIGGKDRYETALLVGRYAAGDKTVAKPVIKPAPDQGGGNQPATGNGGGGSQPATRNDGGGSQNPPPPPPTEPPVEPETTEPPVEPETTEPPSGQVGGAQNAKDVEDIREYIHSHRCTQSDGVNFSFAGGTLTETPYDGHTFKYQTHSHPPLGQGYNPAVHGRHFDCPSDHYMRRGPDMKSANGKVSWSDPRYAKSLGAQYMVNWAFRQLCGNKIGPGHPTPTCVEWRSDLFG